MKRSSQSSLVKLIAVAVLGWAALFLVENAHAQRDRGLSAREALQLVSERFGAESVEWVVEMRGWEGVPEPEEWEVVAWDPQSRYLVREYWAGEGEATNEGSTDDYYPDRSPFGYIRLTDLKLDSKAAFVIAEAEARKAKMGFDSLNYSLRCREFSREPVWTLELTDGVSRTVGKVYISGSTGEVLRTVWIYRGTDARPGGGPLIVDSAAPRDGSNSVTRTERTEVMPPPDRGPEGSDLRRYESTSRDEPDPLGPPRRMEEDPEPPRPPVPPRSGGSTDTRIPPPPLPPEP